MPFELKRKFAAKALGYKKMSDQLHYLSISELSKLIETKVISPVEVTKLLLSRITAIDPELKSYATVMVDEAMIEAEKAEEDIMKGKYRGRFMVFRSLSKIYVSQKVYGQWVAQRF